MATIYLGRDAQTGFIGRGRGDDGRIEPGKCSFIKSVAAVVGPIPGQHTGGKQLGGLKIKSQASGRKDTDHARQQR